jgi:hypothetical protein
MNPCPLCGSCADPIDETAEIQVKDYGTVTVHFSVCEECGCELDHGNNGLAALDLQRVTSD